VTICTKNREHFFGEIVKGKIILSEMGNIVEQEIENNLRENILIDSYVIMPNHVHTIIIIQNTPTPVGCDCIAPE
jgi:REP element-mobilizing transposase RayT